ncbi:pyridine nucleotide-disulfide oxidoreductase [Methylobacterium gregans]|uniref:3-phenylpropionate/cinnamic acid dioxygenase ferredoxin--NAD(+) reductase component n=1 Tax=Methylobacterium gregans TaxID=374424 RepID=A0AA37HPL1_9HYPH|nr:FAD-dependent oxidoreductase [Methylobacterium gregans]MDQ0519537.1 NADPH-dependent 2,4-dienoyl-CoA reductase/sulfur reductase-like enzyme/nitrite reductase/ring-hydroxylating ferredoxin subunit [Methylobacterium gregans]GJD79310.1 3-phenylpropionate/cinnamic acid dioxygenase ferredoxin--NAD(+) reductase component [Methylobacterium gregans]GLS52822.1 pyridine nucleotide-disulfide oxidoreductase [Methylobacterium gregans]
MAEATEIRHPLEKIPLGGMVEAASGEAKVLFVRDADGVRAFQAKCPHLGAPLAKGEICGGRLYCPWHKAAFALTDGGLEEPPALEALTRYPVRIEGEMAVAVLEPLAPFSPAPRGEGTHVLVVGTGAAAVACVTSLRRLGFAGTITMVGREAHPPYDRTKLSKQFLAKLTPAGKTLLEPDFYVAHRVEHVHGTVARIEPEARRVTLEDGRALDADALVIATGSRAVVPDFPGADLDGVHTLRSLDDAVGLSAAAEGAERVVVIGGGFIGLEAAAFLTKRGLSVTVLAREAVPFAKRFGEAVGTALKRYHAGNGVQFAQGTIARIAGAGRVEAVETEVGERLPADIVLIGAGAAPETGAIAGVAAREDGGVAVGPDLRLAPNVWLAGDIAAFPERASGETARIEHWRLAQQHGTHIARQILNQTGPFAGAPFFWSNQGDKRLDYGGYAPGFDRIVLRGSTDQLDFIAYYVRGERVTAACSIGRNPEFTAFLHLLGEGRAPSPAEIEAGTDPRALI